MGTVVDTPCSPFAFAHAGHVKRFARL
jgi:hypothetical protein